MSKHSQAFDDQELRQNPEPAATGSSEENGCGNSALSDDDLERVSAAGVATVPTMHPEVLLGRHDIPADTKENRA